MLGYRRCFKINFTWFLLFNMIFRKSKIAYLGYIELPVNGAALDKEQIKVFLSRLVNGMSNL